MHSKILKQLPHLERTEFVALLTKITLRHPAVAVLTAALAGVAACGDDAAPPVMEVPVVIDLVDDVALTARGVPVRIDVLANDPPGGAIVRTTAPAHGSVAIDGGRLHYTPGDAYSGEDAFEYIAAVDGVEASARVVVTVLPANGVVAHSRLYTAESDDEISWVDINSRGDRVGENVAGEIVVEYAAGTRQVVVPPGPAEDQLVRGISDDGTVIAQYLHPERFQFIGFTWKDGAYGRICDLGDGLGDCTLESMSADGTIVGTAYDYVLYTGFVWPNGGDRSPLALADYASTYAYDTTDSGQIVGIGDDSSDGYSGPSRCFAGTAGALEELPFTESGVHFVFCRATNAVGWIAGGVKPRADASGLPRSATDPVRAALWSPDRTFSYIPFPFERPSAGSWRVELILGLNDDGVMVGYYQDATEVAVSGEEPSVERVGRGITLTPVDAPAGNTYENSTFDHVFGPI